MQLTPSNLWQSKQPHDSSRSDLVSGESYPRWSPFLVLPCLRLGSFSLPGR